MEQKQLGMRSRAASSATPPAGGGEPAPPPSLADRYLTFLHLAPGVQALLGEDAVLARVRDEGGDAPAARSASDFSYQADRYAGEGWRIVGDAGGAFSLVPLRV